MDSDIKILAHRTPLHTTETENGFHIRRAAAEADSNPTKVSVRIYSLPISDLCNDPTDQLKLASQPPPRTLALDQLMLPANWGSYELLFREWAYQSDDISFFSSTPNFLMCAECLPMEGRALLSR